MKCFFIMILQDFTGIENPIIKIKMSDNISFEIQEMIMNKLPVEPLIRFRTVCKAWKSLIDSSDFIRNHITQQNQQHLLVGYHEALHLPQKYVSIPDDDTATFPHHKIPVTIPQLVVNSINHHPYYTRIDSSHGLLCLFGTNNKAVIWNPSIRKAVDVVLPHTVDDGIHENVLGFGVCPETIDPKIIKIGTNMKDVIPWKVEVFTLSARVWRGAYSGNLPSKSVRFSGNQVVVGGVVYFIVSDRVDGRDGCGNLIISFDLTSEEFGEVKLPDSLTYTRCNLSMRKLRESLVVIEDCLEELGPEEVGRGYYKRVYHIWRMEDGVSKLFEKLFSIDYSPDGLDVDIRGFRKTGEALLEWLVPPDFDSTLAAYEPYSKAITNLGINGSFISVYSFAETLLLL
ncbi:putative F-box domain-containing protein [Helianthus annuus]|nr:putative F-box domain-containing protein [Helianthus annuus]